MVFAFISPWLSSLLLLFIDLRIINLSYRVPVRQWSYKVTFYCWCWLYGIMYSFNFNFSAVTCFALFLHFCRMLFFSKNQIFYQIFNTVTLVTIFRLFWLDALSLVHSAQGIQGLCSDVTVVHSVKESGAPLEHVLVDKIPRNTVRI